MRPRTEFMDVDGARLRIRVAGRGPNVLFVHGWALDLDMWQAQFAGLAGSYRLIAFDRRGFGLSSGTPGLEHDLADVEFLTRMLGIERLAVVGMSQGARLALRWAIAHPRRTACLVLDGPPREWMPADSPLHEEIPIAEYRELMRRAGINAVRARWLAHPFTDLRTRDMHAQKLLREMVGRYPGRDLEAESGAPPLRIEDLRRLELPVLVLNGAHDSAERRAAGAALAKTLPQARTSTVAQAGHLANLDNPAGYNCVLDAFLGSVLRPAAPFDQSDHGRRSHAD